ncbi:MAG: hybrid sensor histidine kinase/response regulator [Planctomycetia bacterium]|nr:hybrid sensor histidine kinase/response regulator [Planctomycetia bacterium]
MNRHLGSLKLSAESDEALSGTYVPRSKLITWLANHSDSANQRSALRRYGTAAAAIATAFTIRSLLEPYLAGRVSYGFFLVATVFVAWRCGLVPALASAAIGALLGNYYFESPADTFSLGFSPSLFSFSVSLTIGVVTAFVCESLRAAAIENGRLYRLARQADARKDEFLAMLAHELRNPMAPLRNALYLLDAIGPHERQVEQLHRLIGTQVAHLVRLVDDLLDVSRITLGKIDLQIERAEFGKIVDSAINAVRPLITEKQQDLRIRLPAEKIYLSADAMRLTQVFTNLLHNAMKFTEPTGRIWLTVETTPTLLTLRVRDTGVGMTADELTRAFDLFEQAHNTVDQAKGGLGIGLTLARSLVEMHEGTISADSPGPNLGTEITVRLPIKSPPQDSYDLESDSVPLTPEFHRDMVESVEAGDARQHLKVVVIDDVAATASIMAKLLLFWNHEAKVCHDGFATLETIRTFKPDVVLTDIGLPQMNGYQLAEEIRRLPGLSDVTIIAISGYGQASDIQRSRAAGLAYHLTKPIDPVELKAILEGLKPAGVNVTE